MCSFPDITWICQLREWINSPLGITLMACIFGYVAYHRSRREHPTYDDEDYEKEGHVKLPAPLRNLKLTKEELKSYDSQNPKGKYLLCFLGKLYDVSCCPEDFGPNGSYKELTGTDIMWYIKKTVRYETLSFDAYVEEYKKRLGDRFYVAGVLLDDKKEQEEKEEKTPVADSGSAISSDSGWVAVKESEFKEVNSEGDRNEKQPEKDEDLEKTVIWTTGEAEFKEVQLQGDGREKQLEKVQDLEETVKGEETQLMQKLNNTI
ncbi:hypothetical protein ACLKA7_002687 [Drosophila subpalustris]